MPEFSEKETTNTQAESLKNIVDRNTLVWWSLILGSALLAVNFSAWGSLFWLFALILDDIALFCFGKSVLFDSQLRIRRTYQWIHTFYDNTTGSGRDLGFNLMIDGALSQRSKFEHMVKELGLTKGMVICDVGCGYGDWLKYCRDEVGCETVGINLTPEQAIYAKEKYGLDVHIINWKDILNDSNLQNKLYGKFDAVTFMDTVEHYVSMEDRNNTEKQNQIYSAMCLMASKLFKKNSMSKRVFISCLHQTRKPRTWKFFFHSYFMDKFYSGHYPFIDEGPLKECHTWFDVVKVEDKTEDYRLTGVSDQKHFQAVKITLTPKKIAYLCCLFILDPHVIHRLLYYTQDSWMFFYGDNPYSKDYDSNYRKSTSYVALFWITLQLKSQLPEL
ncbi:MAG: class I SAM-dependent methyltransferase [Candidatus Riflebacteria bacterium]|nr:class I SAM-dependent methyltransferase [Candidatus Riflebacteria bacterium]